MNEYNRCIWKCILSANFKSWKWIWQMSNITLEIVFYSFDFRVLKFIWINFVIINEWLVFVAFWIDRIESSISGLRKNIIQYLWLKKLGYNVVKNVESWKDWWNIVFIKWCKKFYNYFTGKMFKGSILGTF